MSPPPRESDVPSTQDDVVWRALADPTRRHILDLLRVRPRTTGDVASAFAVTRYAVMKHLSVLVTAGLVTVERRGRERYNHLNAVPIQRIYRRWLQPFAQEPADRLLRLKAAVESSVSPTPSSGVEP